jgi:hypothetical protein
MIDGTETRCLVYTTRNGKRAGKCTMVKCVRTGERVKLWYGGADNRPYLWSVYRIDLDDVQLHRDPSSGGEYVHVNVFTELGRHRLHGMECVIRVDDKQPDFNEEGWVLFSYKKDYYGGLRPHTDASLQVGS